MQAGAKLNQTTNAVGATVLQYIRSKGQQHTKPGPLDGTQLTYAIATSPQATKAASKQGDTQVQHLNPVARPP